MTTPFGQWSARIDAATDERARRALLGEIGLWRAQHLTDLDAQRDASWALSEVYARLGDVERAAHEAEQLVALCRTAPVPPREVARFVEQHARRVTRGKGSGAPKAGRGASQGGRPREEDAWEPARLAVLEGRHDEALAQVQGRRGGRAALFRVWARLSRALALPEAERDAALRSLEQELASRFEPGASDEDRGPAAPTPGRAEAPTPRPPAPPVTDSPLVTLVGEPVPAERDGLLALLERWIAAHPDRVDEAAAAALRHHVHVHGDRAVAPWLVGTTGLALASSPGEATRRALADLGSAWAVTAYGEAPFHLLVEVLRAALDRGHAFVALRRGILRRGPPHEGRIWTLRLSREGVERLVAAAPPLEEPLTPAFAARLAGRIAHLCDRALIVAPGGSLAALRDAAAAVQLSTTEATDPVPVLDALEAVEARAPSQAAPDEAGVATRPPREPREPDPLAALAALFGGEEPAGEEAYVPLVERLSRAWRAFVPLRRALEERAAQEVDRRLPALLGAVHRVAPAGVRLAEGVGLAVRVAAAVPGGEVEALLRRGDQVSQRFGGPGIAGLVEVARALVDDGWTIRRALVGVTRRERRSHAGLDPIADAAQGLWRLVVERGDRHGEVWWLDVPSAETRAAIPLLLLEPHDRLVTWPASAAELADWVPAGTPAIAWSGSEAEAVRRAVEAWPERTERTERPGDEAAAEAQA